jgi:hypothetical protein
MATEKQRAAGRAMRANIIGYLIQFEQAMPSQIAAALDITLHAVRHQLALMSKEGAAFGRRLHGHQVEATWQLGENPNKSNDPEITRNLRRAWQPHHVRDALVSALFGEPQRVAA